jgi:hypothetical protein
MNAPRRVHAVTAFSLCAALVLSAAATPVQTPAPELGPLPGKGLAQHPFLYCGEWQRRSISDQTMYIVRDGRIVWSYTNPHRGELGDCHRLRNGNILFSRQFGASEVTPDKRIVWNYDGPPGTEIHTAWPADGERVLIGKDDLPGISLYTVQEVTRLANGNTLINNWVGSVAQENWPTVVQLIEVTPDKKVVWALRDWTTLGPASSTQLLDEPGAAERGQLQR